MTKFTRTYISMNDLSNKLAGRSRNSIYRDVENFNLSNPVRVGSRLYWIEEEVDAFLETRRIGHS